MGLEFHHGRWTYRYRDPRTRKRKREQLSTKLPLVLTKEERRSLEEAARAKVLGEGVGAGKTFLEFLLEHEAVFRARYKRADDTLCMLRRIGQKLPLGPMAAVTTPQAADTLHGYAKASVRAYRAYLCVAWDEAIRRGYAHVNPWRAVRRPRVDKLYVPPFSEDDMANVLRDACPKYRPLFEVIYETGLRKGETFRLAVEDIRGDTATIREAKTGPRVVILSPRALDVLEGLKTIRRLRGRSRFFAHLSDYTCNRHLQRACQANELEAITVHRLRDIFAMRALANGANLADVQAQLGHRSITQTEKYAGHDRQAGARRAIAAMQHQRRPISETASS